MAGTEALSVRQLHAFYGESHILHGVDFAVAHGSVLTLLGRNGSGRTTTMKAIMGIVDRRQGSVLVDDRETIGLSPYRIARLGIGYCPEERGIFASLSCEENLLLPPSVDGRGMELAQIYELFPNLAERRTIQGTRLSGGEQQMLAIARILRTGARILLLDEISEGLAPVIVDSLTETIARLRQLGYTIVMVEQNQHFAAPLADEYIVMERGRIELRFGADRLSVNSDLLNEYLGV